jgi:alcohol dehydrogenase (cytochrome c)
MAASSGTTSGRPKGGTHIGNRGVAMWGNYLYFVTPDDYFVSLDARTGKERWHKEAAPFSQQYFMTSAPMTIGNHIIVGTGNDLDSPGYLMSFDPETGAQQWRFYTVPMNPGDPGLETWKSLDAARHGGGHPWLPGRLRSGVAPLHLRHRQPDAGRTCRQPRGEGWTTSTPCAIVASTSTPARWSGTTRRRRTTRTTGTRRRRRCWSTATSAAAARARWC